MQLTHRLLKLLIVILSISFVDAAQLTTFQLKHRTADQIIPVIQPLLDDSVRLSGQAFQLFAQGNNEQIQLITHLIEQLDLAPKSYQIYVRSISQDSRKTRNTQLDLEISNQGVRVAGKIHSTNATDHNGLQQSVRATEGYPAYLNTGEFSPTAFRSRHASGTQYTPTISGFYLVPQSRGEDQLVLTISQQKQQLNNENIQQQSLSTQLQLNLNQWTVIGEVNQVQNQRLNSGYSTSSSRRNLNLIEIKAVVIE